METIKQIITNITPIAEPSLQKLAGLFEEIHYPKGHLLFRQQEMDRTIYFIKSGIARAYYRTEESDVTFWFGKEGSSVLSYNSHFNQTPGYESIELLEDTILYRIDHLQLETLYETDITISNWGRKLIEKEIILVEERLISRLLLNASQRYKNLMEHYPELLQRVQLNHIASYLGITPVSLSRIRAEIK
ncbi:Crp/Fnr family transcriptional regulator [Pedobacter nyackensis]|uniref:cAMP-binding domain of CRP or a regulatory subunit of cAMP-dependent protein kinases n=1 Tax=Pedobacter nyackensis TaxID=475255 RepID=A0A1W2A086_9SPHI|nr:Crp/Fnr family transcriptional regulator [Pedobacter nyackensis]SMC53821.1 cAMP-binding domain of CRP or a regulatory subunit of cAMP-dependent protein kinases [Pedobacter nyackensis]